VGSASLGQRKKMPVPRRGTATTNGPIGALPLTIDRRL
jgi:hypothetical protein